MDRIKEIRSLSSTTARCYQVPRGEEQDALRQVAAPMGDLSGAVMQTLSEDHPDAIFVVDVQGRLAWGNRQAEQLFG